MSIKKPNLFIVGAPRCGTTSMYTYLNKHPDIFMSPTKEISFFGYGKSNRQKTSEEEYLSFFAGWKDEKYAGEASPAYLHSKYAAAELKSFNPAACIIILLRDPVDFLYSYHRQLLNLEFENINDFEAALEAEPDRRQGERIPRKTRSLGSDNILFYREMAAFTEQVQRYFDVFGREQVHVIILDDMKQDAARIYRETLNFLDVNPDFEPKFEIIHSNMNIRSMALMSVLQFSVLPNFYNFLPVRAFRRFLLKPLYRWNVQPEKRMPMSPQLHRKLQREFSSEVESLGKLLGRDLHHWSTPPE